MAPPSKIPTKTPTEDGADKPPAATSTPRRSTRPKSPARKDGPVKISDSPAKPRSRGRPKSIERTPKLTGQSPSRSKSKEGSPKRTAGSPGRPKNIDRSPKRTAASPSRPKSMERTPRTTGRSPARTKSSERSSSPKGVGRPKRGDRENVAKVNPIRSTSEVVHVERKSSRIVQVSSRKPLSFDVDSDPENVDKLDAFEKPKATVHGRTRLDKIEKLLDFRKEASVESTSSRLSRRSRLQENLAKTLSEFSDDDDRLIKEKTPFAPSKPKLNYDYLGVVVVIISMLVLPAFFLCYPTIFDGKSWNYKALALQWETLDLKVILGYSFYVMYLALISALPFGGRKVTSLPNKHSKFVYVANALFGAALTLSALAFLEYKQAMAFGFILNRQFHIVCGSILVGFLLSVYAFIRSFFVPITALNSNIVDKGLAYVFFIGRELDPRIFGVLDLKMFLYKYQYISELIITVSWLYVKLKSLEELHVLTLEPTFLTFALLQILRIFDGLFYEHRWITTKEIQQEGFGYRASMGYILYPFISWLSFQYILEQNVKLPYWALSLIVLFSLFGRALARLSNNEKDTFRKNPFNPAVSHIETISTTHGKKLLSSGLWGFVKHPNYLGIIIAELALTPFVWPGVPSVCRIFNILSLLYRAKRDNSQCKAKYGLAWDRYSNRVRYLVIPKVF